MAVRDNHVRALAWDDLQLLGAVAAARTLPAAAAQLGLNHSTVFRRLRQIEGRLGVAVFERTPDGYETTLAGAEIVALAGQVAEDLQGVLRRVAGQAPSPEGVVRIATSDALLMLVIPILAAFQRDYPRIRLDMVIGNEALNLSRRDADLAIRATAAPPDTLVGRKVARIAWAAYVATAMVAEGGAAALLETGNWVGFGDAIAGLAGATQLRTLPSERVPCCYDTVGGMVAGVAAGMGIGLLPCFAADGDVRLVRLGAPLPALAADLWLLTHPDLRHAPRIRVLLDFLAEQLHAQRHVIDGTAAQR